MDVLVKHLLAAKPLRSVGLQSHRRIKTYELGAGKLLPDLPDKLVDARGRAKRERVVVTCALQVLAGAAEVG